MTSSMTQAVTSQSGRGREKVKEKKKRSYFSKLFGGSKKSKERREEKRKLALSTCGSDSATSDPKEKKREKKKCRTSKSANPDLIPENLGSKKADRRAKSADDGTPRKRKSRGFFGNLFGKGNKNEDISMISVELSLPTGDTPPDLISPDARHHSITPQSSEREKAHSATKRLNDNNNNRNKNLQKISHSLENLASLDEPIKMTSTPKREDVTSKKINTRARNPRQISREFAPVPVQYESATVGRRPTAKAEKLMAPPTTTESSGAELPRSRSFSGKVAGTNVSRNARKEKKPAKNVAPADDYARQCRETSYLTYNHREKKNEKNDKFLRWHSVGDIQKHVAKERSSQLQAFTVNVTPDMLEKSTKNHLKSRQKSISLQDLSFRGDLNDAKAGYSTLQRGKKRPNRPQSRGPGSEQKIEAWSDAPPKKSAVKSEQIPRRPLDKSLSRSEVSISTAHYLSGGRETPLSYKQTTPTLKGKVGSPKRHSADELEMSSPLVYPTYKSPQVSGGKPLVWKNVSSSTDVIAPPTASQDEVPFYYNMTGDVITNPPSSGQSNAATSQYNEGMYNRNDPPYPYPISDAPKRLPYVSSGDTGSLLRNSKSMGALLHTVDRSYEDSDISRMQTPTYNISLYDQQKSMPDYSNDVEILLTKLRSSLRENNHRGRGVAPPDRPPSSVMRQSGVGKESPMDSGEFPSQFRNVTLSPRRASATPQNDQRGPGISRSRSRARAIAKRFNLSGSSENLSTQSLSLCTSSNWSTELDANKYYEDSNGYCKMKSLVPPLPPKQSYTSEAHAVRRRYTPESGPPPPCPVPTSYANTGVRMRHPQTHWDSHKANRMSNPYPDVRETFYYGRRPVSGSYAEHSALYPGNRHPRTTDPRRPESQLAPNQKAEMSKRTKIFYALDV